MVVSAELESEAGLVARDGALVGSGPGHRLTVRGDTTELHDHASGRDLRIPAPTVRVGTDAFTGTAAYEATTGGSAERSLSATLRERVDNVREGLAFSWHFAHPITDAVVVTIPFSDHSLHRRTEGALTLRRSGEGSGIQITDGTWIDAEGERTPVLAEWADGVVSYRVPAALVRASAFPAVLDPTIGPETPRSDLSLATNLDAPGDQWVPEVCVNGDLVLVVWADERRWGEPVAIYGARVRSTGTLVDTVGLHLGSGTAAETSVWTRCAPAPGGGFAVAWESGGEVHERHVPRDGAPTATSSWGTGVISALVASRGTGRAVLVWTRDASGVDSLAVRRFDGTGAAIDATPVPIASDIAARTPTITATTSAYVVAWRQDVAGGSSRVMAAAVPASGTASPVAVELATGEAIDFTSASDGTDALVAWNTATEGIRGRKVASDGTLLGAAAALTRGPDDTMPRLAHATGGYHLVWRSPSAASFYTGVVAAADAPGLTTERLLSDTVTGTFLGVGGGGDMAVMAYQDEEAEQSQLGKGIWAKRVDENNYNQFTWGTVRVSQARPPTYWADVAWGTDRYGVIHHSLYDSRTNRAPVLEGTLISSDGADFLGFFGGSTGWDGFVDNRYRFSLAAQGGEFLIGFIDYYSSSYGYHGAIQAETGSGFFSDFEIEPWARVGDVATSPSGSSWTAFYRSGSTVYRRTLSSGSSIGSERSVGTGSSSLRDIRAAGDLVTWWDPSSREVAVVRWSGGAAPKRTFATESSWTYNPEIAEGDSTYLYVWEDDPTGGTDRVFAQLIGTDGIASGDTIALGPAQDPDVTWTGSEFLVVMRVGEDIGAVRISGDGVLLDGTPAILTEDIDTVCLRPSVDSDGRRRALVAYDRFVDISGSFQVRTRIVDLAVAGTDPMGAPCENGWTCASGFCADGVCCSAPCTGACETCSASSGATADGACTPVSAGTPCRAADGECDVAESCDGSAGTCPADGVAAAGTACGAGPTGPCDVADSCDGASKSCDASERVPAGTECRPAAGGCDLPERCDGSAVTCPEDRFASSLVECRPNTGACDVPERCDGTGPTCPPDEFRPSTDICRPSAGPCDRIERCTGSGASCPSDRFRPMGESCRPAAGSCDIGESCTGSSAECPFDARVPAGTVCRSSAGQCDPEEVCSDTSPECPTDRLEPAGTVCRAATGVCDIAEACDGVRPTCSPDRLQADGTSCDEGLYCNGESQCAAGVCEAGEPLMCGSDLVCDERVAGCVPPEDDGCGCRVAGAGGGAPSPAWCSALLFVLWRRRRR